MSFLLVSEALILSVDRQRFRIEIDQVKRDAVIDGVPLDLGPREYELLSAMVSYLREKRRRSLDEMVALLRDHQLAEEVM